MSEQQQQPERCWLEACSLEDGYYDMHGMLGIKGKICLDHFFEFLAANKLAVVDPAAKNGLHCHNCKKQLTWADNAVQNRSTGVVRCMDCSLKR